MCEIVILIGLQASGKTTFFRRHFEATHVHVSKDLFPNARKRERRQLRDVETALDSSRSVVVDNTNATSEARAGLIDTARQHGAQVIGYYFDATVDACRARNELRQGKSRVPVVALYATVKVFEKPSVEEGFDELHVVRIAESGFLVLPWKEMER